MDAKVPPEVTPAMSRLDVNGMLIFLMPYETPTPILSRLLETASPKMVTRCNQGSLASPSGWPVDLFRGSRDRPCPTVPVQGASRRAGRSHPGAGHHRPTGSRWPSGNPAEA